jgi:hypothetical protein
MKIKILEWILKWVHKFRLILPVSTILLALAIWLPVHAATYGGNSYSGDEITLIHPTMTMTAYLGVAYAPQTNGQTSTLTLFIKDGSQCFLHMGDSEAPLIKEYSGAGYPPSDYVRSAQLVYSPEWTDTTGSTGTMTFYLNAQNFWVTGHSYELDISPNECGDRSRFITLGADLTDYPAVPTLYNIMGDSLISTSSILLEYPYNGVHTKDFTYWPISWSAGLIGGGTFGVNYAQTTSTLATNPYVDSKAVGTLASTAGETRILKTQKLVLSSGTTNWFAQAWYDSASNTIYSAMISFGANFLGYSPLLSDQTAGLAGPFINANGQSITLSDLIQQETPALLSESSTTFCQTPSDPTVNWGGDAIFAGCQLINWLVVPPSGGLTPLYNVIASLQNVPPFVWLFGVNTSIQSAVNIQQAPSAWTFDNAPTNIGGGTTTWTILPATGADYTGTLSGPLHTIRNIWFNFVLDVMCLFIIMMFFYLLLR